MDGQNPDPNADQYQELPQDLVGFGNGAPNSGTKKDDRDRRSSHGDGRRDSRGDGKSSRGDSRRDSRGDRRDDRDRRRKRSRSRSRDRDRKRRSKSKSPPPRKKKSLWDQAPTGFDPNSIGSVPMAIPQTIINPHQSRQARRLYIGNLPASLSDQQLAEFVNTTLCNAGSTKDNNPHPVIAVQMNREKNFAFVEFSCPEDANAGMGFDGVTLQGHALKVRRPKDYKDLAGHGSPSSVQSSGMPNVISTNVQEGPNKIFIGGLPAYLNEEQVKELLASFGQLRSFNLVKDSVNGNSKGFAFFEYADPNITDRACQGLNGMKLGEKTILVQRATIGARHHQPNPNATSILNNPTSMHFLNLGMPIAAACALIGVNINDPGVPTRIVQLMNAVSPEDVTEDADYAVVLEDLREEAKKYGTVISMYIPRPPPKNEQDENKIQVWWSVGSVFIEYKRKEEAVKAEQQIAGKRFNGRTIVTGFFPEERYERKDFVPNEEEEKRCAAKYQVARAPTQEDENN